MPRSIRAVTLRCWAVTWQIQLRDYTNHGGQYDRDSGSGSKLIREEVY